MKLVAFARYNCMKLMVVELQQQLAELEERERLGAVAEVAVGGSRVPPRNRANPFNSGGRERQGRIWGELHKQFGQEIIKKREEWGVNKDRGGATVHMEEDNQFSENWFTFAFYCSKASRLHYSGYSCIRK